MLKDMGSVIKHLRISSSYSQDDLAKLLHCSKQQLSRIENGTRIPARDILINLSHIFKADLFQVKFNEAKFKNFNEYINFYILYEYTENKDIKNIESKLKEESIKIEFNYGEPLILKNYCKALISTYKYKDYKKSNEICFKTIAFNINDIEPFLTDDIKYNSFYKMLLLISYNLYHLGEIQSSLCICKNVYNNLNKIYTNDNFVFLNQDYYFKKNYMNFLSNYTHLLNETKDFNETILICDKGILECTKLNILQPLPMILSHKIEALINLNNITEAKNTYLIFKYICELSDNKQLLKKKTSFYYKTYNINFS